MTTMTADERMQSEQIAQLAQALIAFQAEVGHPTRDGLNKFIGNTYPTLTECVETVREPLARHRLAVTQTTELDDRGPVIVTTLLHESGEWIRGRLLMPVAPPGVATADDEDPQASDRKRSKPRPHNAQAVGSVITYGRRYGLMAILGLAPADPAEDDDAEAAAGRASRPAPSRGPATLPAGKPAPLPTTTARPAIHCKRCGQPGAPQAGGMCVACAAAVANDHLPGEDGPPGPPLKPPQAKGKPVFVNDAAEAAVAALKLRYGFDDGVVGRWMKHFRHAAVTEFTDTEIDGIAAQAAKMFPDKA